MQKQMSIETGTTKSQTKSTKVKTIAAILSIVGLGLFIYLVYSVGVSEIVQGITKIGFGGFAIILSIYFLRIVLRATGWKLSVYQPFSLSLKEAIPAVIIGEAVSSMIPLGVLASGTSKVLAVRKQIPLVVGFSSIATENLFYCLATGIFLVSGAFLFLQGFEIPAIWFWTISFLIFLVVILTIIGFLMVYRQWHWGSGLCELLYQKGIFHHFLEHRRESVREFEDLILDFYQKYPGRFIPILLLECGYHLLGITEVYFVLSRISSIAPTIYLSFLLESVSRVITVIFKLIPFLVGVDEAGAQFITETLALGAGLGVTLAIIRKGRMLFWVGIGVLITLKRGLSLGEVFSHHDLMQKGLKDPKKIVSHSQID